MGAERGADRRGLGRARVSGAPRVLVSGVVLDQPMGGVRRHNAELLPRAAELLSLALTQPRLDAEPLERMRQQSLVSLKRRATNPTKR